MITSSIPYPKEYFQHRNWLFIIKRLFIVTIDELIVIFIELFDVGINYST